MRHVFLKYEKDMCNSIIVSADKSSIATLECFLKLTSTK